MVWYDISEFDRVSSSDDNPFAGSRVQPTGKVSVKLPVDEWLCRKMEKLNLTITQGYPSRNAETSGFLRDQFIKPPRSSKWYDMHTNKKDSDISTVCAWSQEPAKLNSTFSRVARRSLPVARQDTLTALRTAPIHLHSLFPDSLLGKAEDEVSRSKERRSAGQSHRKPGLSTHMLPMTGLLINRTGKLPAWKQIREHQQGKKGRGKPSTFSQKPAKDSSRVNDNYCVQYVTGLKDCVCVPGQLGLKLKYFFTVVDNFTLIKFTYKPETKMKLQVRSYIRAIA